MALQMLTDGWTLSLTPAGACNSPAMAEAAGDWIEAQVPGTAAGALARAGRFDLAAPEPLHGKDIWYRREISGHGPHILVFEGLATFAEVYLDETPLLSSSSMFHSHRIPAELNGTHRLTIAFRALTPAFAKRGPRARWRVQLVPNQGARLVRTTLLGQMPGWCPQVHAVGPWRPVALLPAGEPRVEDVQIHAALEGTTGKLEVTARLENAHAARLSCGAHSVPMTVENGIATAHLEIENVRPWWPATHGEPFLYPLAIEAEGCALLLGRTGFRAIAVSRGADGRDFAIQVNGTGVFCRGAVWTSAGILDLPGTRAAYEPFLRLARDAGMNMIRISGIMAYESRAFFELCDELGLLVWQDFLFANFDYPAADEAFAESCRKEIRDFLASVAGCPSLALLCGGSEIRQQATMTGLPIGSVTLPLAETLIPQVAGELRPDLPYVDNSPSGGPLPFVTNEGVTHYYGVGAYERPLEDARRAEVRFAAECLAFANLPQQETLDRHLPGVPPHHPRWKAAVPRDNAASWDFEDTREFYLRLLYGADPARLRREDLALWRDASRAVSAEVMEATFAEWRREGSTCNGALVWTLQDLIPGAGWGAIDSTGLPKPAYYGLKRAYRPRQIVLSGEGNNGLYLHVINERAEPLAGRVELILLKDGQQQVVRREQPLAIAGRSKVSISATAVIGSFVDTDYAFRFGPPSHDVSIARLWGEAGQLLAEAFHFPLGRGLRRDPIAFSGSLEKEEGGWVVELEAQRFLQSVCIAAGGFLAEDNFFHLAPGLKRRIRLQALGQEQAPSVDVSALNSTFQLYLAPPQEA
jgi:beta-mannosidase